MLLNASQRAPLYKIAVYGEPGMGKTHLGATSPDPLILLFERHGFETIRTVSMMRGTPMPPTFWIRGLGQLQRIMTILASGVDDPIAAIIRSSEVVTDAELQRARTTRDELIEALPYQRPKTVVLDSLTELALMIAANVDAHGGMGMRDGLEARKLAAWGPIQEKVGREIKHFRDLPYHVLLLCLSEEKDIGAKDDPDIRIRPSLPGQQLWRTLMSAVNAVGHLSMEHARDESGRLKTRRWVRFIASSKYATKCAAPLRPNEPADAQQWFHALEHGIKPTARIEETEDDDAVPPGAPTEKKEAGKKEEET